MLLSLSHMYAIFFSAYGLKIHLKCSCHAFRECTLIQKNSVPKGLNSYCYINQMRFVSLFQNHEDLEDSTSLGCSGVLKNNKGSVSKCFYCLIVDTMDVLFFRLDQEGRKCFI